MNRRAITLLAILGVLLVALPAFAGNYLLSVATLILYLAFVDAAMNDLIRPSLYQSHHEIVPLRQTAYGTVVADVVGPICETADFLARDREMANVVPGDLLAVSTAGAFGFVLSSNYNSRPRPPEVLVESDSWRIILARETYDDLIRGEQT